METTASTSNNNSEYEREKFEDFLEGEYISIKDGESRTLEFIPGKAKVIEKLDFNGNKVQRPLFIVKDPNRSMIQNEKKFELSRKHAEKVYKELKNGKTILEISRYGTGKDTNYIIRPIK